MNPRTAALVALAAPPAIASPPTYHAAVSSAGPALWYQMSETTGNAHNAGSLGSAFDATVNGTPVRGVATYAGDTATRFDSADDFMESLSSSTLTGNPTFTIEAIINLSDPGAANLWGPFLFWGDGGSNRTGREVYFSVSNADNTRAYAGFYNAGQRTTNPVPVNQWIHIVWVRQGSTDTAAGTTLYINGRPIALQQDPALNPGFLPAASIQVTPGPFRVNRASDFIGQRFFTGAIDELALYTRALSPSEVATLAQASGLACYANCDGSTIQPILNVNDFICFQTKYAAGDPYANCDGSTIQPILNVNDFICFQTRFAQGCP